MDSVSPSTVVMRVLGNLVPLSVMVFNSVGDGPMESLLTNFRLTSEVHPRGTQTLTNHTISGRPLQRWCAVGDCDESRAAAHRRTRGADRASDAYVGRYSRLLYRHEGKSIDVGKKLVKSMKSLFTPFFYVRAAFSFRL